MTANHDRLYESIRSAKIERSGFFALKTLKTAKKRFAQFLHSGGAGFHASIVTVGSWKFPGMTVSYINYRHFGNAPDEVEELSDDELAAVIDEEL